MCVLRIQVDLKLWYNNRLVEGDFASTFCGAIDTLCSLTVQQALHLVVYSLVGPLQGIETHI